MRKIFVEVKVKLIISSDENTKISDVINEMDFNFKSTTSSADIIDAEILDYNITDSK